MMRYYEVLPLTEINSLSAAEAYEEYSIYLDADDQQHFGNWLYQSSESGEVSYFETGAGRVALIAVETVLPPDGILADWCKEELEEEPC